MKSLFLAIVLSVFFVGSASAATYGILGAMIVQGSQIGSPAVVQFDGRELFLSEADCNASLEKVLRAKVTRANSDTAGNFSQTEVWAGVPTVIKINMAKCVPTTQLN